MFISDLLRLFMLSDFDALAQALAMEPGDSGLAVLTALACFNTLVQMVLRKFIFWASVAYTGFFMLHQVVHLAGGEEMGVRSCWISRTTRRACGRVGPRGAGLTPRTP